jgi:DNA-binding LacI/PurR family transcriptional regulator
MGKRLDTLPLDPHERMAVAVSAGCNPATVRAYLEGRSVTSTTSIRVAKALKKLGYKGLIREKQAS